NIVAALHLRRSRTLTDSGRSPDAFAKNRHPRRRPYRTRESAHHEPVEGFFDFLRVHNIVGLD
ncbi:MAG: hypothetical protein P1P81_09570, partial [Desulfobulbales bacterium]|nr:hypothetical protein [Desulfobulbales bacterium]